MKVAKARPRTRRSTSTTNIAGMTTHTNIEHRHEHQYNDEDGHSDQHATAAVDAKLSSEKRQEYRALAERRVRLGLVLAEIGRVNNLPVTQEEIGKAMIGHARRFPGQEQAVLDLRKNPQAQESLAAHLGRQGRRFHFGDGASQRTYRCSRRIVARGRCRNHISSERGRSSVITTRNRSIKDH